LKLLYLPFVLSAAKVQSVVASVDTGMTQVTGVESASARDPSVQIETAHTSEASVLDIALVSDAPEPSTAMLSVAC
jgi:hypothetical protein